MHAAVLERVYQCAHDVVLADKAFEACRSEFARKYLIAHR
jgi:hypothetical protein